MLTIECKTSSVIQNTGLLYSWAGRARSDPDVRVIYQCLIAAVHQLPWMQGSYQWDQHSHVGESNDLTIPASLEVVAVIKTEEPVVACCFRNDGRPVTTLKVFRGSVEFIVQSI